MLAKAVAEVLKKHPIVNAAYVEGGIKYNKGTTLHTVPHHTPYHTTTHCTTPHHTTLNITCDYN